MMTDNIPPDEAGNPELDIAGAFVRHTGTHIFLTGKAGTGKTTFLQSLKSDCHKQMIITAPTGVAAVNAGGVTLHSFFQLSFGPYLPGQSGQPQERNRFFRFSREKKQIIKGLDLLVIDEVSMVRADLLDSVDSVLRRLRRNDRPFGGVQLLLIGDLFQLPPVLRDNERALLQDYYPSMYFFGSQALSRTEFVTIELKKIYRQSDPTFINLLNQVRQNRLGPSSISLLEQCAAKPLPDRGAITLTTHNRKADDINREHLTRLNTDARVLTAAIEGEFPETSFPTPDRLTLKKGAQVMFLRNDNSADKRYYNGKIGRVSRISENKVWVTDPEGLSDPVEVGPTAWENITYKVNEENQTLQEEVIGTFSQIPLKLAWAVTIHKSQGLTFDQAVVDARDAFAHGQTYVALSRCRTLDGLVLSSPIQNIGVGVDPTVAEFMAQAVTGDLDVLAGKLDTARRAYQQELLLQCYDFNAMRGMFYYFMRLADNHQESVRVAGLSDIQTLRSEARNLIFDVGLKFQNQLRSMMADDTLPDDHPGIAERTQKAHGWFSEKFDLLFKDLVKKGQVESDNKAVKKQMNNGLANLIQEILIRRAGIRSCSNGFSSKHYLRAISSAGMTSLLKTASNRAPAPDYTEFDIDHPELFKTLKNWRARTAGKQGIQPYQILQQKVLVQIAVCLPGDALSLKNLKGVGAKTLQHYGEDLISLVRDYRKKKGIKTVILPKPKENDTAAGKPGKQKQPKSSTKQVTLALFNQGMDAQAVADERGLALSTIQGHLVHFIENGTLDLDRVVPADKQAAIEKEIRPDRSPGQVKAVLGDDITYGEIKAVMAHRTFREIHPG